MVIMFLIAVTHVSLLSNQQCKLNFVVFVAMSQCLHFTGTVCLEYQFSWAYVEQYLLIELSQFGGAMCVGVCGVWRGDVVEGVGEEGTRMA